MYEFFAGFVAQKAVYILEFCITAFHRKMSATRVK